MSIDNQTTDRVIDEAADIAGEMGREDIAMEILKRLHSRYADGEEMNDSESPPEDKAIEIQLGTISFSVALALAFALGVICEAFKPMF